MRTPDEIKSIVAEKTASLNADFEMGLVGEERDNEIVIDQPGKGHIYIDPKTGEILEKTRLTGPLVDAYREALEPPKPVPAVANTTMPQQAAADCTLDDVKKYICPEATDQEAYMFMKLCQARGLNPFTREAYLVKYGGQAATTIVGKDAFTRRAEQHPKFNGFRAGIIVEDAEGNLDFGREGTFYVRGKEKLVGGWAEVWRKDRDKPFRMSVSMDEYDKKKSSWNSMPGTMIRKVALVGALREAFPSEFGGLYDSAEMGAV